MYLALEAGAEMWIQCLTLHFARKAIPKTHVCTSELYLRAFSGAVAIQLPELSKKGNQTIGNGLCLLQSELGWELFLKVLSGP